MRFYSFFICDEVRGLELGGGYIRARNAREAKAALPYPNALITPAASVAEWPNGTKGQVAWAYRAPELQLH
ncbi:MAG: hypothetical protein AAGE83_08395 [Pseudomonadota bacterium]